jgi:hypothetical protein
MSNNIPAGAKGSDKAVITRPDGSSTVIDKNTGRVVQEFNSEGKQVVRLVASTPTPVSAGGSGGSTTFISPTDQRTRNALREFQEVESANARAESQANFRTTTGNLVRVDYDLRGADANMTPNANFRTTSGALARVDVSVSSAPNVVQERGRVGQVIDKVKETKAFSLSKEFITGEERIKSIEQSTGQKVFAGSPFGFIGPAGPLGPIGAFGKTVKGAKAVDIATRAKKTESVLKQGAIAIGGSVAISETTKNLGTITSDKQFLKEAGVTNIRQAEKELFIAGRKAEMQELSGMKGVFSKEAEGNFNQKLGITGKKILAEISILGGGAQGREAFIQGVRSEAQAKGLNPEQAESFALRQRRFRGFGEIGSFAFLSTGTEIIGTGAIAGSKLFTQQATTFSTKKGAQQLFKTAGVQIAKAGAVEGAGFNLVQISSRSETFNPKSLAFDAAFGATTAGIIGGTIVAQQVRRPAISKALYAGAVLTDPFEIAGDVSASQLIKRGVVKTKVPSLSISPTKDEVTIGRTKTSSSTSNNNVRSPMTSNVFTFGRGFSFVPTTTLTSSPTTSNVFTFSRGINIFNINTPTNTTDSPTNALVTATTPTITTVPVNVTSYKPQLPPPLIPFGIPSGSSGKGSGKKKSVFIDELSLGINFLKKQKRRFF